MIGLIIAIVGFNLIAFTTNKRLTANQIVHIWTFTSIFQGTFDSFVDFKFHAYWYFTKDIDWKGVPAHLALLPPVNMIFLNWYPFKSPLRVQTFYFIYWGIGTAMYELITLLPEPWGYLHYGWWRLWYSVLLNPILLLILLGYYKWIVKIEKNYKW
ncbi:hypothetical protein [Paenibacillus andongensis]|uniref:hypothetical protein n=1 Tax=Paenibacillus andongensis TaxID=2975482 RepID=UPI0021BA928C|nr:hypothetical protein [Paenibacillus andongensis]